MVAGEALSRAEESSDASEISMSPPPQECSPFEARTWEEVSDEHQQNHATLPLHQEDSEQSTALLDAFHFEQSMNPKDLGRLNLTQEHVEQSSYRTEAGDNYL